MSTKSVIVAAIGLDAPGVVATVSGALSEMDCNTQEMTQSTLAGQFAGIFLVGKPETLENTTIASTINSALSARRLNLTVSVQDALRPKETATETEPFVISVFGPDRKDILAVFSRLLCAQNINIDSLRGFPFGTDNSMQVFEVSIPKDIDTRTLQKVLLSRAKEMNLHLTMQHRAIFEVIHRVAIN